METYAHFEATLLPMEIDIEYKHMTQNLDTKDINKTKYTQKIFLFLE
jgi:hypothetical protein